MYIYKFIYLFIYPTNHHHQPSSNHIPQQGCSGCASQPRTHAAQRPWRQARCGFLSGVHTIIIKEGRK